MSKKQNPKPAAAPVTRKQIEKNHQQRVHRNFDSIEKDIHGEISHAAEAYWNFLSNPFQESPARPVFYDGTYVGNTGLVRGALKATMTVGTQGIGWVSMTMDRGPTSKTADCPVVYSTAAFATDANTTLATNAVGMAFGQLTQAPYSSSESRLELLYRPVAGALRITPRGSMTSQDGTIAFLEIPGHVGQYGTTSFDGSTYNYFLSHPRTRVVRAAQLGDPSVVNQLNWHPQAADNAPVINSGYPEQAAINDIKFRPFNATNTTAQFGDCHLLVSATPGLQFEIEFVGVWEVKGAKATGLKPSIQDAHASAIIFNTLCRQKLSGLVGKPFEFRGAYQAPLHHTIKKTVASARDWLDVGRDIAGIVKEVAGFVL